MRKEKEMSTGAMLGTGITVIAVLLIVGVVALLVLKNINDKKASEVDDIYTEYDNTEVSGKQVKKAYQTFEGQDIAILMCTTELDKYIIDGKLSEDTPGITVKYKDIDSVPMVKNSSTSKMYINYNKIINHTGDILSISYKDTYYNTDNISNNDKQEFNNIVSNFNRSGTAEYISTSYKFKSNLLKDSDNNIVGIVFEQLN